MSDDQCPCCGDADRTTVETDLDVGTESSTGSEQTVDRWLGNPSPLDSELPTDVQSALARFLGVESVDTLGAWARAVRNRLGGNSIAVEELCHAEERTPHWGIFDGERYYFACFYDAVILAAIADRPVDVRTESPDGAPIEAHAVGSDELSVAPGDAVFSFGIDDRVDPPLEDGPTLEDGYAAICPYVRAFPSREAYLRWAEAVPAATVAMPLSGATELAAVLVGER